MTGLYAYTRASAGHGHNEAFWGKVTSKLCGLAWQPDLKLSCSEPAWRLPTWMWLQSYVGRKLRIEGEPIQVC